MNWVKHETKIANHVEYLRREDGTFVGYVIRFNANEQTFAWTDHKKLGVTDSIGAAKDLVEEVI